MVKMQSEDKDNSNSDEHQPGITLHVAIHNIMYNIYIHHTHTLHIYIHYSQTYFA